MKEHKRENEQFTNSIKEDVVNTVSRVFGNKDNKAIPSRELIVFTNNGQTYHFENVTNFRPTTTGFSFTYHGKATGVDRDAVFNNTSVAGWAFAEQH